MRAAFAIPGELTTVTGGYLYEKRLLDGLRDLGVDMTYLRVGDTFPAPTGADASEAAAAMATLPADVPLIVDGLVFGSLPTALMASIRAPIVAMLHHPLAHEEGLDAATREHLFRTERDNLTLARAVLVPSTHTARILIAEYGVDPALITIARPGTAQPTLPHAPADPPLILSVGIQHPRKGHDVLLRALARLTDLDWESVIVGTPYDAHHVAELARLHTSLGLAGRVTLAGAVSDDERDALYARASIFALATRYEGYGLVFDEALAWGLPIVSCATGAAPETVPADTGMLVAVGDDAAVAGALRTLLSEPHRRDTLAAAAAVAGAELPRWRDTCTVAARVLTSLQP